MHKKHCVRMETAIVTLRNSVHSLPSQRFHALLNLFSQYFSSFLHSTCLLSVSARYLALWDNHPRFSAPFPKYATLKRLSGCRRFNRIRDFHPLWPDFPIKAARQSPLEKPPKTAIHRKQWLEFELFLVHSPLLKESYSFYFPPLTYMLKFSG